MPHVEARLNQKEGAHTERERERGTYEREKLMHQLAVNTEAPLSSLHPDSAAALRVKEAVFFERCIMVALYFPIRILVICLSLSSNRRWVWGTPEAFLAAVPYIIGVIRAAERGEELPFIPPPSSYVPPPNK